MEIIRIVRALSKQKLWVFAAAVVAVAVSIPVAYRVSLSPPGLHAKSSQYAGATTTVLIDRHRSALADVTSDVLSLGIRASVYAQFSQSGPVVQAAAAAAGIQANQIATTGPFVSGGGQIPGEAVANQLIGQGSPYRMNFEAADPTVAQIPTMTIYAQAPTPRVAEELANGAVAGLVNYINNTATADGVALRNRVYVRQLSPARGGLVATGVSKSIAIVVAIGVWLLLCLLIVVAPRLRQMWRDLAHEEDRAGRAREGAADGAAHATAGESRAIGHDDLPDRLRTGVEADSSGHGDGFETAPTGSLAFMRSNGNGSDPREAGERVPARESTHVAAEDDDDDPAAVSGSRTESWW